MKKFLSCFLFCFLYTRVFCWGFYAHREINHHAVYLLPPSMLVLYKPNSFFLTQHAVDPDKKRYLIASEASHHFIDIDHYGKYPFESLPRNWSEAVKKYSADTLQKYGIAPWWALHMLQRLTTAFSEKNKSAILKLSAELGHYIADMHVPLHASSNHDGQLSGQQGIHAFWESRIPELLADKEWNLFTGPAIYITDPSALFWKTVEESGAAADTVLRMEKQLSRSYPAAKQYAFEEKNGVIKKQYAASYTIAFNKMLNHMVERRMRQSIFVVASCWYTAWVNAGQPDLQKLNGESISESDKKMYEEMDAAWRQHKTVDNHGEE